MLITLSTDNGKGQPVPGAVISFYRQGAIINQVAFPGNTGVLYFDSVSDANLFGADVDVRVTAPGYNTAGTTGNAVGTDWIFTMRPNGLNTAVVVGAGLGALLLIGVTAKPKKKKIMGIKAADVAPWLPIVGLGVVAVVVYNKFFSDPQSEQRDTALNNDIVAAEAVQPATLSDSEIAVIANQLKEDLTYSAVSNDYTDAARQLTKPTNTADMLKLIQAYGKHYITFFGIPTGSYTLEETVTRALPQTYITEINAYYAAQGINFKF